MKQSFGIVAHHRRLPPRGRVVRYGFSAAVLLSVHEYNKIGILGIDGFMCDLRHELACINKCAAEFQSVSALNKINKHIRYRMIIYYYLLHKIVNITFVHSKE